MSGVPHRLRHATGAQKAIQQTQARQPFQALPENRVSSQVAHEEIHNRGMFGASGHAACACLLMKRPSSGTANEYLPCRFL